MLAELRELVQNLEFVGIATDQDYLHTLRTVKAAVGIMGSLVPKHRKRFEFCDVAVRLKRLLDQYDDKTKAHLRHGRWMPTYSGRRFWPLDPRPDEIETVDIMHGLARLARFNGATLGMPYSVAQHSVLASYLVPLYWALPVLLHDAHEPYTGDLVTPMKPIVGESYQLAKREIQTAIARRYGFEWTGECERWSKYADEIMLATEVEQLVPFAVVNTEIRAKPAAMRLTPVWGVGEAEERFINRLRELLTCPPTVPTNLGSTAATAGAGSRVPSGSPS